MRSPQPLALSVLTAATAGISLAQPLPVVPSWRRSLQAAENCPCEACVEDSTGDGQIAQCEAQGMDCSCYTDCALCRLCTKFNSSPRTCMEVCRGGCAAATPVPSCFDVQSRTTEIDTKCCDAAWGEECDGNGIPSSCDFGCSSIFLPFWADCASDLGLASDSRLIGVVSLCQASATACVHSPCANGGECTAIPPYMGGFRCNCAEGYSGDDCSEGGSEFIVPEPSLRELAGERLLIGTAANIARIASGQYAEYTAILRSDFSILTPENCMKMTQTQPLQGQWDFADADALLSFASSNNILVRAHNLIWTGRNPDWLFQYAPTLTPAELDVLMQTHIATTVGHFRGQVYSWDVVNEAIANNVPQSESCGHWRCWLKTSSQVTPVNWNRSDTGDGTFYIERAFRAAAIADPSAKLFYNEYGIHTGVGTGGKFDNVYAMLSDMLDLGVPIHGVGMQMHINNALRNKVWDPDQFRSVLSAFSGLGLEIHLTEFDVIYSDPIVLGADDPAQALADIYTGVMSVCLEFEACKVVSTWGFTDEYNRWGDDGNTFYYDRNYLPKLPRTAVADLLQSQPEEPDCVDDPDGRLNAVAETCATAVAVLPGGCAFDLGSALPGFVTGDTVRHICPVACNACS